MWLLKHGVRGRVQRRLARLADRARARRLHGRDPWRFARALAGPGDRHLALALDWLVGARGKAGAVGPALRGYTIGQGWQAPCLISTALLIKPLWEGGQRLGRPELITAALDSAEAVAKALGEPQTVEPPEHGRTVATLAHAILGLHWLARENAKLASCVTACGYQLEHLVADMLPAPGYFLAPPALLALALHLSGRPIPENLLAAVRPAVGARGCWYEFAMDVLGRTEYARCTRDADALTQLQPLIENALLEFERKKGLWEGGGAVAWCAPGAGAALALVWFQFGELTSDHRYLNAALKMNEYLKDAQMAGYRLAPVRGALRGSDPIFVGKFAFDYPTWCTGLFADTLLAEERVMAAYDV
jgi:hypothetical protein